MLSAVSATVFDGRTRITLRGDGPVEPASVEFAHDLPPRLVIDLPAVGASVPAVTRVGRHDVQRIRVGTNRVSPLVTRVVVDLSQRLGFRVTRSGPGGNDVAIVLDAGPAEATVGPTESDAPASGAPAAVLSAVETAVVAGQVRITLRGDRWLAPGSIEYARDAPPRLVIDTAESMFAAFERRHGARLPVMAGDITPYWEDGALSSAAVDVLCRATIARTESDESADGRTTVAAAISHCRFLRPDREMPVTSDQ